MVASGSSNASGDSSHPVIPVVISAIDDSTSLYFLYHSDSTGLVLVSQLLVGDNYASWSRAMTIALSIKNKLGFINGSLLKPDGTDLNLLNS